MTVGGHPRQEGRLCRKAGLRDGARLLASFSYILYKGGGVMTDYEIFSLVIMIIMLVFAALSFYKNDR